MPTKESKREKAKEVVDILEEISILLVGAMSARLERLLINSTRILT